MQSVRIFLLISLFYSCTSDRKDEVLNMNDLTPQARQTKQTEKDTSEAEIDFGFSIPMADSSGITVMEMDFMKQPMFPDRFMPDSILKLKLDLKEDKLFFGQWIFADSLKTRNALFNWLDCFGANCNAIKYLSESRFQNEAMLLFVNDTSIIYLSSKSNLDEKKWQHYLELKYGIDLWKTVIVQSNGKKAKWYSYEKLKQAKKASFIPLKKE